MPITPSSSGRRSPRQERSLGRVQAILDAAAELILERGSGSLKMAAVAKRAGVTTGSIYQYFPNTTDIVRALAESYAEQFRNSLKHQLQGIESKQSLMQSSGRLFEAFYAMYRDEPLLQEIWLATGLDKSLQDMDIADSRQNAELMFEAYQPYFPPGSWNDLRHLLFLICHLSGATVRLALAVEEAEGQSLLAAHQQMIEAQILALMSESGAGA